MRRVALLGVVVAGIACGKGTPPVPPAKLAPSATVAIAAEAGAPPAKPPVPPFVCGTKPVCPADRPAGERPIVEAIRSEAAEGRVERAAALVACLGNKVRLETDPGFSSMDPSPDSTHLLLPVEHDDIVRVFDAKTWAETMRLDGALSALSASGSRAVVNHRGGGATLWDLAGQEPLPIAIPSNADVSTEGTAVYWTESSPRRGLVIAGAKGDVARIPIETKETLTLAELPGGQYLASTTSGRHWIVDPGTSTVVQSFYVPESRPARVAKDVLILDVGKYVAGFDFLSFAPSHAPLVVALGGKAPPQPLTGRGCTKSVVIAVSDDGAHAVTRAADAWCLFDVPSRRLLGKVDDNTDVAVEQGSALRGTFVGPDVVVGSIGHQSVRLRVKPGKRDPLFDLEAIGPAGTLVASARAPSLKPRPVERAWVGTGSNGAQPEDRLLHEVGADGTIMAGRVALDWDLGVTESRIEPKEERVIGQQGLENVRSCLLRAPHGCIDLPLGGAFAVSRDGTWAAGPPIVGPFELNSAPFARRNGALAVASVSTGKTLLLHHAPGFEAAAFTSETELALLGEDGALLRCALDGRTCTRVATRRMAGLVRTERRQFVIADGRTVLGVPALPSAPRAASVAPRGRSERMRDQEGFFHVGRSLVIELHNGLQVKDARTGAHVRTIPMDRKAVLAASVSPPRLVALTGRELAVFDLETGNKLFSRKVSDNEFSTVGAVAIDATGARVAFVDEKEVRVFDVDGKERGRWPIAGSYFKAIAISPDGTKIATTIEVETPATPKGKAPDVSAPADHFLLVMDPSAPAKVERVSLGPLRTRTARGLSGIELTNSGYVVLTYIEGGAFLVDPSRKVYELSREATDDGVWLRSDAGISSLGPVAATSRGLGCRLGAWMLPTEACLPALCSAQ